MLQRIWDIIKNEIAFLFKEKVVILPDMVQKNLKRLNDINMLFGAIRKGDMKTFLQVLPRVSDELKEKGICTYFNGKKQVSFLLTAIAKGRDEMVAELLKYGENPNYCEEIYGCSLLMFSIMGRRPKIAKMLIEAGVDLEHRNLDGETALMMAVLFNDLETTKLLLERGVRTDLLDKDGTTVYDCIQSPEMKQLFADIPPVDFAKQFYNPELDTLLTPQKISVADEKSTIESCSNCRRVAVKDIIRPAKQRERGGGAE